MQGTPPVKTPDWRRHALPCSMKAGRQMHTVPDRFVWERKISQAYAWHATRPQICMDREAGYAFVLRLCAGWRMYCHGQEKRTGKAAQAASRGDAGGASRDGFPQAPPPGTRGVIEGSDGAGDLQVRWDTGSALKLIPGVDEFRKPCPKCGVREALEAFEKARKV